MYTSVFVQYYICTHYPPRVILLRGDFMAYSEAAYRAAKKYRGEHIKRIPLDVQISYFEEIKAHAAARGESVNGFIKRARSETMRRDTEGGGD